MVSEFAFWRRGDLGVIGWHNPKASVGVAMATQDKFGFVKNFAVFLGENDGASVVTKLFNGDERRVCEARYYVGFGGVVWETRKGQVTNVGR
jgi:hypothetical protein